MSHTGGFIMVLLLLMSVPARAQQGSQPDLIHYRNDCRLAAQVLETGHPHPKYEWALGTIMNCEEEGPPILVQMWRKHLTDTTEVGRLLDASGRIRDRRIYEEVRRVALDRSKPDVMRVGALIVLSEYVDSGMAYSFPLLAPPPGEIRRIPSRWGSGTPVGQLIGPDPLSEPVDVAVIQLYEQLAQDQSNRSVWFAASVLARNVRKWVEQRGIEAARALAQRIARLHEVTDTALLRSITMQASGIRHPLLADAALRAASEPSLGERQRVAAVQVALAQHDIGVRLPAFDQLDPARRCAFRVVTELGYGSSVELEPDYLERLVDLVARLATSTREPPRVRAAAQCVLAVTRDMRPLDPL